MRYRRGRAWWQVPLVVTALAVFAVAGYLIVRPNGPANAGGTPGWTYSPIVTPKFPPQPPLSEALPALRDSSANTNIAVLGDSTSAALNGWVYDLGHWLAARYRRPVYVEQWTQAHNNPHYLPDAIPVSKNGKGRPIVLWNASASGQDATFATRMVDQMIPEPARDPVLILVSHGHNDRSGAASQDVGTLVQKLRSTYSQAVIGVVVQNPKDPASSTYYQDLANLRDVAEWGKVHHYPTIDVLDAFLKQKNWQKDLIDPVIDIHPSRAGYTLWAETVERALG